MLLERLFPGATTCVLVGGLAGADGADFSGFTSMLWFVEAEGARHNPPGLGQGALQVVSPAGADARRVAASIDKFIGRDPRHLPSLFVTEAAGAGNAGAFQAILEQLYASVENHHRARETRQKDGFLWQKHIFLNLDPYAGRRVPEAWAGALRGVPAFVCGAGPSLDASVGRIAEAADRAVIFSADSAQRALARRGIKADFAISIDVAKVPEKCLPADHLPERVVLSGVSPPSWHGAVPVDNQFFVSNRQVTLDWLGAQGLTCTPVSATESCGSTGIELARFMGCSPIYLFGLDLALDPSAPASRHNSAADATVYKASGFDASQKLPRVPGNYGADVATHIHGDLQALNRRLSIWPQELVFNVNDRGARLDNTTLVHPDRFSVGAPEGAKIPLLSRLAPPVDVPEAILSASMGSLRRIGESGCAAIEVLRCDLDQRGPEAVCARLRQLFADRDFARALGSFSLKMMPHLTPPTEGDAALWSARLGELQELVRLASSVGVAGS
jgi:hypothetical protein